jgi:hypothetical protein
MKDREDPKVQPYKPNQALPALGACLITNPQTGDSECIYVTKDECTKAKGTFIGGPCAGF